METTENMEMLKKIQDYREIIRSFADLLTEENKALTDYNLDVVSSLYAQKTKTVSAYRTLVAFFIKNQAFLNQMPADDKNSLKEETLRLDNLLKENDLLLRTRMETSKNVMDSIVNLAKVTNNSNATSYGAQGKYTPLDNSHNALAINRTL